MAKISSLAVVILLSFKSAFGMNVLNQIKAKDGSHFILTFSGLVAKDQTLIEYMNNTVQITFTGVSIYPAKSIPVEQGPVSKVFAYQYSPKVVRCRFTLKEKAENFKGKIRIGPEGKLVSVTFGNGSHLPHPASQTAQGQVAQSQPAKPIKTAQVKSETKSETMNESESSDDIEEKALYEKVVNSNRSESGSKNKEISEKSELPRLPSLVEKTQSKSQEGGLGSRLMALVVGPLLKLAGVLLLFLALVVGLKKLKSMGPSENKGLLNAIGKFARGTLGQDDKMIQVVSTHYLDPKKSIAVVRVAGRLLVLGIANDSINLITQLTEDSPKMDGDGAYFSDVLFSESEKPLLPGSAPGAVSPGARSRIRSRLEGLKPL